MSNKHRNLAKTIVQTIVSDLADVYRSGNHYYQMGPEERQKLANDWVNHTEKVLSTNYPIIDLIETYTAYYDGSANPNPGQMRLGGYIKDSTGKTVWTLSKAVGSGTNNQAEYLALLEVSKELVKMGAQHVEIYGDSDLTVKQVNGEWKVKNPVLKVLCNQVRENLANIEAVSLKWIRRNQNKFADELSKG